MQMIRTTITLPSDFHEELMLRGISEKKSLGQLVMEKFGRKVWRDTDLSCTEKAKKDNLFLRTMANKLKSKKIDWAVEVRKQRTERMEHLAKFL